MNSMPSSSSTPTSGPTSTSHSPAPSLPPSASQTSSLNGSNPHTPPPVNGANGEPGMGEHANSTASANSNSPSSSTPPSPADADKQIIIEALKSKDRIYVLKLGEQMESMIKERRQRLDLISTTSYQRLLIRRCSAYYNLAPESDPITKGIAVLPTTESRIPEIRICELVPPESSSQPTFKKIMLRKPHSQAGSVAGEDADLSDVEPSEAGSLGGRSNAAGSSKKHMTIEEREAAYNKARSRIFMDFEEKEKTKDNQINPSSSSVSLNSASASTSTNGDISSVGDEGSVSSPTTESEWSVPSGPVTRERKDIRRGGNASASSSSRSIRSGAASYGSNNSSRNSRASSPSFHYPTLYEPAPTGQLYDPNQPPSALNSPYSGTQYYHPFAPPSQPSAGVYVPPYPYYAPYPYQAPPPDPHHNASDPSLPRGMEQYTPPQAMNYAGPYMWSPHGPPPPSHPSAGQSMATSPHHAQPPPAHTMSAPPAPTHYGYPQPPYGYPVPAYHPLHPPPPGQTMAPPPPPTLGIQHSMYELPRSMNGPSGPAGNGSASAPPHAYQAPFSQTGRGNLGNGSISPQQQQPQHMPRNNQRNVGNSVLSPNGSNGGKRSAPAGGRTWSYGSNTSAGGYSSPTGPMGGDSVGPRLNSTRRQSNNSASSSNYSRASSNNDDVSSIASSSTTSSSSRRTYTSTASSQHPLPPRPDWAVGLKAQPTLASREHSSRHPGLPISPSRGVNGSNNMLPVSLQNDFPPLTPLAASQEKRPSIPNGAWGNAPNKSILSPPGGTRSDDGERGSERPSSKNGEQYNPKLTRRPTSANDNFASLGIDTRFGGSGESMAVNTTSTSTNSSNHLTERLVNQIQSISIEEKIAAVELASSSTSMMATERHSNATATT